MTSTPAEVWSDVASAWSRHADHVEASTVAVTEALVEAADVHEGDQVLELAAGPGVLAPRWSSLVGPSGHVVVSDVAPRMVDTARERTTALANVDVAEIDATAIDLPAGSFDVVVCRMGLMFAPDPAKVFREIHRVLRPGGRCAAATWAGLEQNPWMTCVGMAAAMNGIIAGAPPVGPGGIFSLGDPSRLAALARDASFDDVVVQEIPAMFRAETIEVHVDRVSSLAGPLAAVFAEATPEQVAAVCATAAQLAGEHISDAGIALPGLALVVAGRAA